MRTALGALWAVALLALAAPRADAQEATVRFPVSTVTGTIFTFSLGDARWVEPGLRGIVVDPRQQDVLVARFRVVSVSSGTARAEVSGQTTAVTSLHMALLDRPRTAWYRNPLFWIGAGAGALAGLLIGGL